MWSRTLRLRLRNITRLRADLILITIWVQGTACTSKHRFEWTHIAGYLFGDSWANLRHRSASSSCEHTRIPLATASRRCSIVLYPQSASRRSVCCAMGDAWDQGGFQGIHYQIFFTIFYFIYTVRLSMREHLFRNFSSGKILAGTTHTTVHPNDFERVNGLVWKRLP